MENDNVKFKNSCISRFCLNKFLSSKILTFLFVILIFTFSIFNFTDATSNIDATYHYAWNDNIGWIDFYSTGNINVSATQLMGYASSSVGYIALDCATSPNGDICSGPAGNWKVSNDANGNLTGWAYNDAIGWISFDSATASSSYVYQVTISPSTGDFSGWAWNDNVGWISFNCSNTGVCGTSDYKVKTNWRSAPATAELISSIFDTGVSTGAAINTIMWQGDQSNGTGVKFQIASDSTSTPTAWIYRGPDGSDTTYYTPTGPDIPAQINSAYHNNHRYFRYKIFLSSDAAQTQSPKINDVIINWSP